MFEELFKNFINDGIMVKTDRYWVSLGGRGNDIYKVKRGYKGALKEVIKELGFKVLQFNAVVKSNVPAIKLYKKLGFVKLGIVPEGYLLKDGSYEDIVLFYYKL